MMKRLNKRIALILCMALFLESLGFGAVFVAGADTSSTDTSVLYEESFDRNIFESTTPAPSVEGVWVNENPSSGNGKAFTALVPRVENGVMKLAKGESAQFNWQDIEGFTFDNTKTYTFRFDVTLTDTGDNVAMSYAKAWKRELYVAPGGYYNQVEFRNDNGSEAIRAGDSYAGTEQYKLNTKYSVEIVWQPAEKKITSTIKDGDSIIVTGFRTSADYANADSYLAHWVFRCEDGASEIDNFYFSDGTKEYTQNFDSSPFESTAAPSTELWTVEKNEVDNATAPSFENGIMKLGKKDSVCFNWTNVEGVGEYDISTAYVFEFDVKITDAGNNENTWTSAKTRSLYIAMGGYYNQVEFVTKDNEIRAGDTYVPYNESVYLNKPVHVRVSLEGGTINSSICDANGNVLVAGSRTSAEYTDMSNHSAAMTYLVMRCEDGAAEIDNFKFSTEKIKTADSTKLTIASGKAAIYECDINVAVGETNTVKLNGVEAFSVANGAMSLCGSAVSGNYGTGKYSLSLTVNPDQKMVFVEVVLPNGGTVRRGSYTMLVSGQRNYNVEIFAKEDNVSGVKTSYTDVKLNSYNVDVTEPVYEGFGAKVYNLITSFEDPCTTRSFAWTALESYIGSDDMELKYRKKGESEWTSYTVKSVVEGNEIQSEDYFKADISGLSENTEYEYKIGKKGSADEANDWSKVYTFKTAASNADEFTFIAVGDTQGVTWNGTTNSTKGFMFGKTAYEEAFEEVQNPAFILHTGDVVQNGGTLSQWNMFFKTLGEFGASTPHFAAIGNHDVINVGGITPEFYFNLHFNHPNNGGSAALDTEYTNKITNENLKALVSNADETIYSYNYGDAHFIVLNSGNYTSNDEYIIKAQRKWLEADLKANADAKWTIIMVHEPVYHRLGGDESRPWLYDIIEGYGVDLVIQGHSHLVTRTYPMKDGKIVTKESPDVIKQGTGTVYTTIGATAYNHDSIGNPNVEECLTIATPSPELSTYTVVKVSDSAIEMTVKQIDGLVLDSFRITADESDAGHTHKEALVGQKDASCKENGYTGDKVCSECNEVIEKGEVIPKNENHVFGEWVVVKEPTDSEKGEKVRTCSTCGESESEEIPSPTSTDEKGCGGINIAATLVAVMISVFTLAIIKKKN